MIRHPHRLGALLLAALASACAHGGDNARPGTPSASAVPAPSRGDSGDAITRLNRGDVDGAHKVLARLLKKQPDNGVAAALLKSIDSDPVTLLGRESFAYTSRPGDTFTSLAARFLGQPLMFYALARYNDVAVPDLLKAGKPLRIPGHEKSEPVKEERPAPPVEHEAPPEPKHPTPPPPPTARPTATAPAVNPARAAQLRAAGLEQMNRGAIDRAVVLLAQASRLDPANPLIKRDLDRAVRIRQAVKAKH